MLSVAFSSDGRTLASNRLAFQPDWNFSLNSDYVVPLGNGEAPVDDVGNSGDLPVTGEAATNGQ